MTVDTHGGSPYVGKGGAIQGCPGEESWARAGGLAVSVVLEWGMKGVQQTPFQLLISWFGTRCVCSSVILPHVELGVTTAFDILKNVPLIF